MDETELTTANQTERTGRWWTTELNRRTLLRGGLLGGAGLAAAALIGCGDDDDDDDDDAVVAPTSATDTDGDAADAVDPPGGIGKLVQDPNLPYPYNYPEPATTPKPGGVMKVAATWDVGPMDPTVSAAGGTVTVPNMVYNRLLGIVRGPAADPFQTELEPELAQSWERSPDGLSFTFNITPGVKWQNLDPLNGRPFVAEDARYALERYATEGVHQSYYVNVASFETVDDATLKITMAAPTADFLNPLGSNKQTIFPRELVDSGRIETEAIGTGPMIMTEATPAQKVAFDKNPDYWEGQVLLDGFEFLIRPDAVARLAEFRVGHVDYGYSVVATPREVEALVGTNPDVQINLLPLTYNTFTLGMNLTLPKYADERVRRALSLAIDREEVLDIVYDGLGKSLHVIPWPYIFDEEPTMESGIFGNWLRFDPEEAMKLLTAAGAEGLEMENSYYAYSSAVTTITEIMQAQLKDVGVTMSGGKVDYTEYNSQWVPQLLPDVSTSAWGTSGFDADNWFFGQVHSESPGNRWRMSDPEIDEWAAAQQLELDPDARRELHRKIWDKDLEMMYRPSVPGGFGFDVLQPWVRGIRFGQSSPNDNSSYYTWGDQVWHGWLDK
ncbi:MAG: ABC transporter substrate-binding protein [Chloroflexi bacterium]|nr:ABC transporter substrate-binding protein [Chloroflexota bacterium]